MKLFPCVLCPLGVAISLLILRFNSIANPCHMALAFSNYGGYACHLRIVAHQGQRTSFFFFSKLLFLKVDDMNVDANDAMSDRRLS